MSIGTVLFFCFIMIILGAVGLAIVHILNSLLQNSKITGDYNV